MSVLRHCLRRPPCHDGAVSDRLAPGARAAIPAPGPRPHRHHRAAARPADPRRRPARPAALPRPRDHPGHPGAGQRGRRGRRPGLRAPAAAPRRRPAQAQEAGVAGGGRHHGALVVAHLFRDERRLGRGRRHAVLLVMLVTARIAVHRRSRPAQPLVRRCGCSSRSRSRLPVRPGAAVLLSARTCVGHPSLLASACSDVLSRPRRRQRRRCTSRSDRFADVFHGTLLGVRRSRLVVVGAARAAPAEPVATLSARGRAAAARTAGQAGDARLARLLRPAARQVRRVVAVGQGGHHLPRRARRRAGQRRSDRRPRGVAGRDRRLPRARRGVRLDAGGHGLQRARRDRLQARVRAVRARRSATRRSSRSPTSPSTAGRCAGSARRARASRGPVTRSHVRRIGDLGAGGAGRSCAPRPRPGAATRSSAASRWRCRGWATPPTATASSRPRCRDGELRGLLHFVPWGTDGLSLDLMRRDRNADNGLNEFMIASLIERGAASSVSSASR